MIIMLMIVTKATPKVYNNGYDRIMIMMVRVMLMMIIVILITISKITRTIIINMEMYVCR